MAATSGSTIQLLCEESSCSICLDYFRDPVIITECGHNFCQACLNESRGESDTEASCPQCRGTFQKRNLRPNWQLANFVEIARKLGEKGVKEAEGKGRVCEKHQEPLKLFCRDHKAPICLVCDRSEEHEGHQVVPLEEASQEYQDLLYRHLESLRKERGSILACKAEAEWEKQKLLEQMMAEREDMVAQFRRLHQFLEEQEKRHLAQVDELQEEIARKAEDHLAWLSKELSSLEGIMREVEEKSQQLAAELLQDVRSTLQRCEKEPFENPVAFPPELKERIWDFWDINHLLEGVPRQFKAANVTLDPDTAHPKLILPEDRKSVRMGDQSADLPDSPKRFTYHPFVLGCEGFTRGRHSWEVRVGSREGWAVGVARESVSRKSEVSFSPKEGFWVLRNSRGTYKACSHAYYSLAMSEELKTLWVSLNCDAGRVAFYDADRGTLLYAFSRESFAGETLFPFFYVYGDALLQICS
ncbi:Zinc finger protein RFP [Varanus komodoensis]|nr:Zinc finger protein RFP [Varanus komodoensis]